MACVNHPEVISGLDTCTACAKTFCIDCLVGRKSGWFCSACDPEPRAAAAAPAPGIVPAAKPKVPAANACLNHPEVVDRLNPCALCRENFCPDCVIEFRGRLLCAQCKVEAVKDVQSGVQARGLQLAGILPRFAAHIVDSVVTTAGMFVIMMVFGGLVALLKPDPNSPVVAFAGCGVYVIVFGIMFGYHGLMLQYKGATLGKMALKIKVVTPEGRPITPGQAWIRVLVWFFLANCGITYIPAFFNAEKMTIHDMAAKTRVVKVD